MICCVAYPPNNVLSLLFFLSRPWWTPSSTLRSTLMHAYHYSLQCTCHAGSCVHIRSLLTSLVILVIPWSSYGDRSVSDPIPQLLHAVHNCREIYRTPVVHRVEAGCLCGCHWQPPVLCSWFYQDLWPSCGCTRYPLLVCFQSHR